MLKTAAVILGALALAGCGDIPVVGKIGQTPFKGTIHRNGINPTGTIAVASAKGAQCIGEYSADSMRSGSADLRCDDGRFAVVHFRSTAPGQGFGEGFTDKGEIVSAVYGLPEDEASVYLKKPAPLGTNGNSAADGGKRVFGGTGFFINDRGDVLTNRHVVRNCSDITARLPDGRTVPAKAIYADGANDLAIVRVDETPAETAVLSDGAYRQGDTAIAYGFPLPGGLAQDGVLTTGTISALAGLGDDSRFVQMSTPIQPGNSGGPLADSSAHVVGVVTAELDGAHALKKGILPQNVNFAIKESVVKTFLGAHAIPFRQSPTAPPPLAASDVGAVLKSVVVAIACTETGAP
ncbi:MAG: serine protease [Magnetospirillum sp.]|nr:serine protease [Magnetospirillum sp.]